jgi:hypothetical protein
MNACGEAVVWISTHGELWFGIGIGVVLMVGLALAFGR